MQKKILIILTLALLPLICLFTLTCGGGDGGDDDDSSIETKVEIPLTVIFYKNKNEEVYITKTVNKGQKVNKPDNPEGDENFRFIGWYVDPKFTEKFEFNKDNRSLSSINSDIKLYPRFISNNYIPTGEEFTINTSIPGSNIFIEDENGVRNITIPSMYVCDHETTQAEWSKYMKIYKRTKTGDNYPIQNVNWYECIIYCNLRSEAEGLIPAYYITIDGQDTTDVIDWMNVTGSNIAMDANEKFYYTSKNSTSAVLDQVKCNITANGYRIPTEAEWEFIARGGSSNDATYEPLANYAWCKPHGADLHEIKTLQPNTLGIYDILGNVSEICYDRHGVITSQTDIFGAEGSLCVRRGGCYVNTQFGTDTGKDGKNYPTGCNVEARGQPKAPYERSDYGGLRVICTAN